MKPNPTLLLKEVPKVNNIHRCTFVIVASILAQKQTLSILKKEKELQVVQA